MKAKCALAALLLIALLASVSSVLAQVGTVDFEVTAVWQGGYEGALRLTLYANGKKMDPQPEYEIQDGNKYVYKDLPRCSAEGKDILYSAKEHYFSGYVAMYVNKRPHYAETRRVYDRGVIINRGHGYVAMVN